MPAKSRYLYRKEGKKKWWEDEEEQEEEREKQENRCLRSPAVPSSGPGARQRMKKSLR